jgi:hypothetical protein
MMNPHLLGGSLLLGPSEHAETSGVRFFGSSVLWLFERESAGLTGSVVPPPLYYALRFVAQQQKAATKESKAAGLVNTSDCVRAGQMSTCVMCHASRLASLFSLAPRTSTNLCSVRGKR